jgi:hypothetical protein
VLDIVDKSMLYDHLIHVKVQEYVKNFHMNNKIKLKLLKELTCIENTFSSISRRRKLISKQFGSIVRKNSPSLNRSKFGSSSTCGHISKYFLVFSLNSLGKMWVYISRRSNGDDKSIMKIKE